MENRSEVEFSICTEYANAWMAIEGMVFKQIGYVISQFSQGHSINNNKNAEPYQVIRLSHGFHNTLLGKKSRIGRSQCLDRSVHNVQIAFWYS